MKKTNVLLKKRSVDFPVELHDALVQEAEESYLSFSAVVRVACQDYLLKRGRSVRKGGGEA